MFMPEDCVAVWLFVCFVHPAIKKIYNVASPLQ